MRDTLYSGDWISFLSFYLFCLLVFISEFVSETVSLYLPSLHF